MQQGQKLLTKPFLIVIAVLLLVIVGGVGTYLRFPQSTPVANLYNLSVPGAAKELKSLEALKPLTDAELAVPYQTALGVSIQLLKNPYRAWNQMDVFEKHKLFFFIFSERLAYSKVGGYQTADLACATRLFTEFAAQKHLVCGDGGS